MSQNKKDSSGLSQKKALVLGVVIVFLAVLIGGYFYGFDTQDFTNQSSQSNLSNSSDHTGRVLPEGDWQKVIENPDLTKGAGDAEVILVEFTDYQCPYCARHVREVDDLIQENFVDNGKIKYIMRDLPLSFHSNAYAASLAARCAGDQNKYWEMHDALFNNQKTWAKGEPKEEFLKLANAIGINAREFESCFESNKHKQAVDRDLQLAQEITVGGTPVFFINGKELRGAQPYAVFDSVLTEELAK